MKTIGLVVDQSEKLAFMLKDNIFKVLEKFVKVNIYYLSDMKKGDFLEDDIILAMTKEKAVTLHQFVTNKSNILVINRTITVEAWLKISKIPKESKVLVVNDNYMTTIEFTEQLYGMLDNIEFEPYKAGNLYSKDFIVITPFESNHVPVYLKNIFDTGHRVIDSSTFIAIIAKLGMDEFIVQKNLLEYLNEIVPLRDGIHSKFKELAEKDQILKSILDNSINGIAIFNTNGYIKLYNDNFLEFLDIGKDDLNLKLEELLSNVICDTDIDNNIVKKENFSQEIYVKKLRYFNITKRSMIRMGSEHGILITITEITYIKKIEQKLAGKLNQNGQIARYNFNDIKTKSQNMYNVINLAKKVAPSNFEILINGESGTGKELFAQSIHNYSKRCKQPFIAVNCAAIPENLLESELFGYDKGSFTGALKDGKKGLFEAAHNGTIFLDEIGDMSSKLQTKLLRVLQEKQISRLGSNEVLEVDVRIIAATHKNLVRLINEGKFRADLYYRINVIPLKLPSLKERKEDILMLLNYFLDEEKHFSKDAEISLINHDWTGNIRELENTSKYISLMTSDRKNVECFDLPEYICLEQKEQFNQISTKDNSVKYKILEIIYECENLNKSSGRTFIKNKLNDKLTEAQVRRKLEDLKRDGYIYSIGGRSGSKLTELGKKLLKE